MASFWFSTLCGAAILVSSRSDSDTNHAGDADCSELIEFTDADIRDSGSSGSRHASSGEQQERNSSHFILLDDCSTAADSAGGGQLQPSPPTTRQQHLHLDVDLNTQEPFQHVHSPELQKQQPTAVHSSLPLHLPLHHCVIPPVTPGQHYQGFGSKWLSCGTLETSGPVAQQLPQEGSDTWQSQGGQGQSQHVIQVQQDVQQEVRQECELGMAARRKVVRLQQQYSHSSAWEAPRQVASTLPEDAPASAVIAGPDSRGMVITAEPVRVVLNPNPNRQLSSKKRLLDLKILELQLKGQQPVAMSEKMIREELGNNPDTSKALRRLTQEGKLLRTGKGGRSSPFSYIATQEAQQALQQMKDEEMRAD